MFKEGKWVTTIMGIIGVILMALGMFMPDKVDPETQLAIKTALNEILVAGGALVQLIANIFAKDPETVTRALSRKR